MTRRHQCRYTVSSSFLSFSPLSLSPHPEAYNAQPCYLLSFLFLRHAHACVQYTHTHTVSAQSEGEKERENTLFDGAVQYGCPAHVNIAQIMCFVEKCAVVPVSNHSDHLSKLAIPCYCKHDYDVLQKMIIIFKLLAWFWPHICCPTLIVLMGRNWEIYGGICNPLKAEGNMRTGKEGGRCSLVVEVNRRTMITGERLISQRGGVEGKLKALQLKKNTDE